MVKYGGTGYYGRRGEKEEGENYASDGAFIHRVMALRWYEEKDGIDVVSASLLKQSEKKKARQLPMRTWSNVYLDVMLSMIPSVRVCLQPQIVDSVVAESRLTWG